jgi:hypothetical protein
MNDREDLSPSLDELQAQVRNRLGGLVQHFRVLNRANGLVITGRTATYYAKQLAQHAVMEASVLPILANDIEVR